MATLKERLEQEKQDFEKVLKGEFLKPNGKKPELINIQAKFIEYAIQSIDYMLMILEGKVVLPKVNEDEDTSWGKVFHWMQGSIVNITMAEAFVYGQWTDFTDCFKCMYMSLADYVNESVDEEANDNNDDYGLADEVNTASYVDEKVKIIDCESESGLADVVNEDDDDDDCRYCGEHGDCCDCFDIPVDCCDIF
ncbi:MAG: hypothetical protein IJH12_10685 [Clostridia bacterium]|nr:hypothetical protein [Clostridia bacterium]